MATKRASIEAMKLFGFAGIIGDRLLIATTVGPHLNPVILSLEQEPDYRDEAPGRPSFPKKRSDRPNQFRIHHRVADDVWHTLDLPETDENYHAIQPLDDEWLLVRGRADGEGDRNAHVYDAAGRHVRSFHAGDGIEDVQTTEDGKIWVSYFDEGVFGRSRLGRSGLVCLDGRGRGLFDFAAIVGGEVPGIADCYALNVASGGAVWLCYYMDFPLVRLVDGKVEGFWRHVPSRGSPGFAIEGDMALFAGGYKDRGVLHLVRLGEKRSLKMVPTDEGGRPLKKFSPFGRKGRLHLQTRDALYVIEVADPTMGE
jgi:hypothetical protein